MTILIFLFSVVVCTAQITLDTWQQTGWVNSTALVTFPNIYDMGSSGNDIYLLSRNSSRENSSALWYSQDSMKTFIERNISVPNGASISTGQYLALKSRYIYVCSTVGILRSSNKGISWENCTKNEYWNDAISLEYMYKRISISDSILVYRFSNAYTIAISTDYGSTWLLSELPTGNTTINIVCDQNILYALQNGSIISRSRDFGGTWQQISKGIISTDYSGYYFANGLLLLYDGMIRCILRFNEQEQRWKPYSALPIKKNISGFTVRRNEQSNMLHLRLVTGEGTSDVVVHYFRSSDNGNSWEDYTSSVPKDAINNITCVSNHLVFSTPPHYVSTDDGSTWYKEDADQARKIKISRNIFNSFYVSQSSLQAWSQYVIMDEGGQLLCGTEPSFRFTQLVWSPIHAPDTNVVIESIGDWYFRYSSNTTTSSFQMMTYQPNVVVSDTNGTIHTTAVTYYGYTYKPTIPINPIWKSYPIKIRPTCIYSAMIETGITHFLGIKGGIVSTRDFSSNRLFEFGDSNVTVRKFLKMDTSVYAMTNKGVWVSDATGLRWSKMNTPFEQCNDICSNGWYAILVATDNGIYRLSVTSRQWQRVGMEGKNVTHLVGFGLSKSCLAYVAGEGVYIGAMPFSAWYAYNNGLPAGECTGLLHSFVYTPINYAAYITLRNKGIYKIVFSNQAVGNDSANASVVTSVPESTSTGNEQFSMYPNPASDELTVHSTQDIEKVEVYSLLGEKVKETEHTTSNRVTIPLTSLAKGAYRIVVYSGMMPLPMTRMFIHD